MRERGSIFTLEGEGVAKDMPIEPLIAGTPSEEGLLEVKEENENKKTLDKLLSWFKKENKKLKSGLSDKDIRWLSMGFSAAIHAAVLAAILVPKDDVVVRPVPDSNQHFIEMSFERGVNTEEGEGEEGGSKEERNTSVQDNNLENSDVIWDYDDGEDNANLSEKPINEDELRGKEKEKFQEKQQLERIAQETFKKYKQELIDEFSSEFENQSIVRDTFLDFQKQLLIYQYVAWEEAQHKVKAQDYDVDVFFSEAEEKHKELQTFLKPHKEHVATLKTETEVFDYLASFMSQVEHQDKNPNPLYFSEGVNCVGKFHMATKLALHVDPKLYLKVGAEISVLNGTGHISPTVNSYVINPNRVEMVKNPQFIHGGELYKSLLQMSKGAKQSAERVGDNSDSNKTEEYNGYSPTGKIGRKRNEVQDPGEVGVNQKESLGESNFEGVGYILKERLEKIKELEYSLYKQKALNIYKHAQFVPQDQMGRFISKKTRGLRKWVIQEVFGVTKRPSLSEPIKKLDVEQVKDSLPAIKALRVLSDGLDYFSVNTANIDENRYISEMSDVDFHVYPKTLAGINPNTTSTVYIDELEYFNLSPNQPEDPTVVYHINLKNLERFKRFNPDPETMLHITGSLQETKDMERIKEMGVVVNFGVSDSLGEELGEKPDMVDMSGVEVYFKNTPLFENYNHLFLNYKVLHLDSISLEFILKNLGQVKAGKIVISYTEGERYEGSTEAELVEKLKKDPRITLIKKAIERR